MFLDPIRPWTILLLLVAACAESSETGSLDEAPGDETPADGATNARARAALKTKTGARFIADLAQGLGMAADEICREVGTIDCLELHGIPLLEVEPRELRIQAPIEGLVTGAFASDRVALLSCAARVEADLAGTHGPSLVPEIEGGLTDPDLRRQVVDRLSLRLVRRASSVLEQDELAQLYEQLPASDNPVTRAQTWVTLSCFALATLTENLFY